MTIATYGFTMRCSTSTVAVGLSYFPSYNTQPSKKIQTSLRKSILNFSKLHPQIHLLCYKPCDIPLEYRYCTVSAQSSPGDTGDCYTDLRCSRGANRKLERFPRGILPASDIIGFSGCWYDISRMLLNSAAVLGAVWGW